MVTNRQPSKHPAKSMVAVRLAVLAMVFTAIGIYLYLNWNNFSDVFKRVSTTTIALVLLIDFLYYIISAIIMRSVLLPYSIQLGKMESFEISMATRFGNLLIPMRGGAVARAVYLNKRYQFSPETFVASLSGMLLTSIFTALVWVGAGLVFTGMRDNVWFSKPLTLVAFGIIGLLILTVIPVRMNKPKNKILTFAWNLAEGWAKFKSHKSCLIRLVLCYSSLIILQSCIYTIILNAGDVPVHWSYIVVLVALGNASLAFQITPGNAGVYEGLLAGISSLMGLDYQAVLAAGLTWRVIDAVFVFAVGGLASRQLTRRCHSFLQSTNNSDNTKEPASETQGPL